MSVSRGTVAFVVDADPVTAPGDRQVVAATRLAAALAAGGHGAAGGRPVADVRPVEGWTPPPDLRAVVTASPRLDPALVPDDVASLAWVVDHPMSWPGHPGLALFDAVLAGSELMRARLERALEGAGTRPLLAVLPLAAEHPAGTPAGPAPDTPAGPAPDTPAGPTPGPAARRRPAALARLLRRGAAATAAADAPVPVKDAVQAVGGIVPVAVYETLAAGRLPRPASRLGLAEVGLGALAPLPGTADEPDVAALRDLVTTEHTWTARAADLAGVLDRLAAAGGEPRAPRIGFFPDFRSTNPYQNLLYADLVARGVRIAPVRRPTESLVLRDAGGDLRDYVLHVHWAEAVAQVVTDPAEAGARLKAFQELLLGLKERGARVAWTVHNVLPHDVRHRDVEIELCRFLAEQADVVHVLGEATPELTRPYYELRPESLELVPHSSYDGVYPDVVSREAARRRLGILPHDVALLALGGIRPYRGLDTLLDAFDTLLERDLRVKLLVAGKPGTSPETRSQVEEWIERCERHPRIVARFGHVPDSDLQLWHRAADVAVLPYRGILNSGAFKLAQTFGLPVVAPRAGNLARELDREPARSHALGFDPDVPGDLLRALEDAADLVTDPDAVARANAAARAAATAYPPSRMAADFAGVVARRLGVGASGASEAASEATSEATSETPSETPSEAPAPEPPSEVPSAPVAAATGNET